MFNLPVVDSMVDMFSMIMQGSTKWIAKNFPGVCNTIKAGRCQTFDARTWPRRGGKPKRPAHLLSSPLLFSRWF
jgi:hypothetical protein